MNLDIKKCTECGMLRAKKDVVLTSDENFICFSCWNKQNRKKSRDKPK
jgi:formylmethanofuran dehydrogenase subunit E